MRLGRRFIRRLALLLTRDDQASALIEFAVCLPLTFTFLFCFMELCLMFYSHNLISELAREGTRYAAVRGATCANPTTKASCTVTAAQVNTFISSITLPNLAGGTLTPDTTFPSGNQNVGSIVNVTVTYVFKTAMPFVPKNTFTMTSTSQMRIIQ